MQGNSRKEETSTERLVVAVEGIVAALLPVGWQARVERATAGVDGYLVIQAPEGSTARLVIEAKAVGRVGSDGVVAQALGWSRKTGLPPVVVTDYAAPALRRACEGSGINYVDLTGWVSIRTDSPAVALRTAGPERDPRPRQPAVIRRFSGAGAGRVIRTLLGPQMPGGIRALSEVAGVSPGTVSKVLKVLDSEALVERDARGQIRLVRKRDLVQRWIQDYGFPSNNRLGWYLDPRGLDHALSKVVTGSFGAVGTGSVALRRYLPKRRIPVTPIAQLAMYVPDLDAARGLGLAPTERGIANVILAVPYDARLLDAQSLVEGQLPVVGTGQTVADLLTLPGRGPEEADQLMSYLAEGDAGWS